MNSFSFEVGKLYCSPDYFLLMAKDKYDFIADEGLEPTEQAVKHLMGLGRFDWICSYISVGVPFLVLEKQNREIKVISGEHVGWINGEALKHYSSVQEL